jgi:hypothetical protein
MGPPHGHNGKGNLVTDINDAGGITEVAQTLHAKPTTVGNWFKTQPDFPQPVRRLSMGPIWDLNEVARWHYHYKPMRKIPKVGYVDDDLLLKLGLTTEPETPGANNGQS